jgi:chromosome partitioning protein
MGEIISIISQKGGVGKTTTAINLCASLAIMEQKVLLLDLDPQECIATSFKYTKYNLKGGIHDVIHGRKNISDVIHFSPLKNLDFVPNNFNGKEDKNIYISSLKDAKLKNILNDLKHIYDFIIIDCPPALNNANCNALIASDSIIVPIQCEYYALKALGKLLNLARTIKKRYNPNLQYRGFLLTMVDQRNNLTKRVMYKIQYTLKDLVFNTIIPRNIRLAEGPYYGKPVLMFDRSCKGATSYLDLAHEIMHQNGTIDSTLTIKKDKEIVKIL